jgi:hypothetical protein
MARFPFKDLHAFKDFPGFVRVSLLGEFPHRDLRPPEEQWTLELAFEGLRYGLELTAEEKGEMPPLAPCRTLVEEAYVHYQEGRVKEGYLALEKVSKLLKKIPSQ